MKLGKADFNNNLTEKQQNQIDLIRNSFRNMYQVLESNDLPLCRETDLGVQKLEEAQMWLIKGISRSDS